MPRYILLLSFLNFFLILKFFDTTLISIFKTYYSVQFSHSVVSDSLWSHELQHARPPCPSPTLGVYSNSSPLSRWCLLNLLSSPSPPALNLSQHQGLFKWVSSSHQVAKVLEFQLQLQSFLISFRMEWLDLFAVQRVRNHEKKFSWSIHRLTFNLLLNGDGCVWNLVRQQI